MTESDHNPLILKFQFDFDQKIKTEQKEIYNVRNLEGQKLFKELTTNNPNLVKILSNCNIYAGGRKWLKELKHVLSLCFKKIRISKFKRPLNTKTRELFTKRENIKSKMSRLLNSDDTVNLSNELKEVDEAIAEIDAKDNFAFIQENLEHLLDNSENNNSIKIWNLKK